MSARRFGPTYAVLDTGDGDGRDARRIWARNARAAWLASEAAPTDAETDDKLDLSLRLLANLASAPSPDITGIAAKLASLMHLMLQDDVRHFDAVTQVGFALTASALADAVLIGDRPIGIPAAPNRDSAGAA